MFVHKFYSTEKVTRVNLVTFVPFYADIVRTVVTGHMKKDDGIKIILTYFEGYASHRHKVTDTVKPTMRAASWE